MARLLGPPGICRTTATNTVLENIISQTSNLNLTGDHPYRRRSAVRRSPYPPAMGLTENLSATYLSSGNACLDFFFHVVPDTPPTDIIERLHASWAHDPLTTLKLICNLRGVRGTGKNDKESFYTAALWLHKHHPKALSDNLAVISKFGYLKDLPEILFRILEGLQARSIRKTEWLSRKIKYGKGNRRRVYFLKMKSLKRRSRMTADKKKTAEIKPKRKRYGLRTLLSPEEAKLKAQREAREAREAKCKAEAAARMKVREANVKANMAKVKNEQEKARVLRKKKELEKSEKALLMYKHDMDYQYLHDNISTLFADLLKADMQSLYLGSKNISLAGKWCPTIDSSYDKYTLICESIAKKVFPLDSYPEYEGLEEAHYTYRVRDRLRKQVLVPLHKRLKLPEVFMSAKKWNKIPYNRVASVAMKTYTDIFMHRDSKRFREYLQSVKSGETKIAAGALLPHEIIQSLSGSSAASVVAELQWKRMVDDLLEKGKLRNCIAVADVSASMSGTPMEVAIALGLLISELSEEPWKGQVITFSRDPQLHLIQGSSLLAKTEFVRRMDWGNNTDFQKVFDRILEVAVKGNLNKEQMVERVFVFSDMEFDEARSPWKTDSNPWETDYQAIQRKFSEKGYEKVPQIVFWNLRDSSATPVTVTQSGVALLSGFSKNLLTLFLEGGGEISLEDMDRLKFNPEAVMEAAISGEEYEKLVVYDVEDAQKARVELITQIKKAALLVKKEMAYVNLPVAAVKVKEKEANKWSWNRKVEEEDDEEEEDEEEEGLEDLLRLAALRKARSVNKENNSKESISGSRRR